LKIRTDDKILVCYHKDMDGVGCSIVLKNVFENVAGIGLQFGEVDEYLKKIDYEIFDWVFVTDLHPNDVTSLDISEKLILLDHHGSAESMMNPKKNRFVVTSCCGTVLTKRWCETYFNIKLTHLNNLAYLVDDYDLWKLHNYKSKLLNELYYFYHADRFLTRFFTGDTNFTQYEIAYLRKRIEEFKKHYDSLELFELKSINGCIITNYDFINDTAEKLMKTDGFDVVIAINQKYKKCSVRHKVEGLDIGKELIDLFESGGGHEFAGAFNETKPGAMQAMIQQLEQHLFDKFPKVRK